MLSPRYFKFILFLLIPCTLYLIPATLPAASAATVTIAWDKSPESNVDGYEIAYGKSSGKYDYVVDVGNNTSCSISGLEEGTTYYFAVKAYNSEGVKSAFSEELVYTVPLTNAPLNEAGPRITEGLQALYTFDEASGMTVHDTSDVGAPLDLTVGSGTVNWVSGGLAITSAALLKSAGPATKLIEACRASNEISIEAWIKPANTTQGGPARIVTLSQNPYGRNFTLGQAGDTFNQRLRTTATDANGRPPLTTPKGFLDTELTHVLYTFNSEGIATIYVNGTEVSSQTIGGNLSNWSGNYAFGLANEMTMDRPWLGELYLVAIYDRALNPQEINQNFQAGVNSAMN